jgi:hypothetical protein
MLRVSQSAAFENERFFLSFFSFFLVDSHAAGDVGVIYLCVSCGTVFSIRLLPRIFRVIVTSFPSAYLFSFSTSMSCICRDLCDFYHSDCFVCYGHVYSPNKSKGFRRTLTCAQIGVIHFMIMITAVYLYFRIYLVREIQGVKQVQTYMFTAQ